MRRNIYKRIEAVTPILDTAIQEEMIEMLNSQVSGNVKACYVDENLNNIFKYKRKCTHIRAQYVFYNYLKRKNEIPL